MIGASTSARRDRDGRGRRQIGGRGGKSQMGMTTRKVTPILKALRSRLTRLREEPTASAFLRNKPLGDFDVHRRPAFRGRRTKSQVRADFGFLGG
jgi:hypothetical protein